MNNPFNTPAFAMAALTSAINIIPIATVAWRR